MFVESRSALTTPFSAINKFTHLRQLHAPCNDSQKGNNIPSGDYDDDNGNDYNNYDYDYDETIVSIIIILIIL